MRFNAHAARSVGNDIDLVTFAKSVDGRESQADFRPKRGHHDFLSAGLLYPIDDTRILSGVDESAVDRLLIRENVLQRLKKIAALSLDHSCQKRRHTKHLWWFSQAHDIVDDGLRVVTTQASKLEWLMID